MLNSKFEILNSKQTQNLNVLNDASSFKILDLFSILSLVFRVFTIVCPLMTEIVWWKIDNVSENLTKRAVKLGRKTRAHRWILRQRSCRNGKAF